MADSKTPEIKPRPFVRLVRFLISHSFFFSVVCCAAGVLALLLLPLLAKKTYVSENALIPGSAKTMLSSEDIARASGLMKEIDPVLRSKNSGIEVPKLIAKHMSDLGAEVGYHKFHPQLERFHPLHFFTGPDSGVIKENFTSLCGVNVVGIVRAPRGDGKESIVLVTPYNLERFRDDAASLGIAYSVFSLLTRVPWLAKDIIWLAADSQFGEYTSVASWLQDYHALVFRKLKVADSESCDVGSVHTGIRNAQSTEKVVSNVFRRAGTMAAALVIKVVSRRGESKDTVRMYAEASNGQMPNLDLINVVNYLALERQGLHVKVGQLQSLLNSRFVKNVGVFLELLGKFARSVDSQFKFGISVKDYVESSATLASSLYTQALGIPTGSHGAFRDYQVDAITLEISPRVNLITDAQTYDFILRGGRLVEGVVRSVNNLLEKFHQSFFLYLLSSPSKFVSVGIYMLAFALLAAPLPMVAAYLYTQDEKPNLTSLNLKGALVACVDGNHGITVSSWKWLHAAKQVFFVHFWGAMVSLLPYFICQIPNYTSTASTVSWILLSLSSLFILHLLIVSSASSVRFQPQNREWATLKSVMISVAFIGLSLMSVVNFATAEFGALLVVPMCLIAHPLKLDIRAGNLGAYIRAACTLILGLIGFPPVAFLLLKGSFEGFRNVNLGDYWIWLESLWAWNSATYVYILMVHTPCWALCIQLLFHSC